MTLWAPQEVVGEHKRRANTVWMVLILCWIASAVWTIYQAVNKLNNPPTKTAVIEEPFRFPDVEFCFYEGEGCLVNGTYCAEYANVTVWDISYNFEESDGDGWPAVTPYENETFNNCRTVKLSGLTPRGGLEADNYRKLFVDIKIDWPIEDEDGRLWDFYRYSHGLDIFSINDAFAPWDERVDHFIGSLQFDLIEPLANMTSTTLTTIALKKTQYKRLGGESEAVITGDTINTHQFVPEVKSGVRNGDFLSGTLYVSLEENELSFLSVEEINPVEFSAIVGAVGGFWQYVVLGWGLFFITVSPPKRTARNLGRMEKIVSKVDLSEVDEPVKGMGMIRAKEDLSVSSATRSSI